MKKLTIQEQLQAIKQISGLKTYVINGNTFNIKEDLKAWGWEFDWDIKKWVLRSVLSDDPKLRCATGIEGTWIEVLS